MLLDRIDIDAHGPLQRVELGPFSEHLNVVRGPEGSGKTAIARFVRDSLVERDYPLGMLSSSTGRVVFADGNGLVHCRREKDGTAQGRRHIEFESRGELDHRYGPLESVWLDGIASSTDSHRAAQSLQVSEALVDSVLTDTAVTSVARVVSACVRGGLDCSKTFGSLPLTRGSVYEDRESLKRHASDFGSFGEHHYESNRQLRSQLAEVEAELGRLGGENRDYESLVARRTWLTHQLARTADPADHGDAHLTDSSGYGRSRRSHLQSRASELHDRARRLRARQSELRGWVAELDADRMHRDAAGPKFSHQRSREYYDRAAETDVTLSRQLEDLDAQMIRWRRALSEVRGLRRTLVSGVGLRSDQRWSPVDEQSLRRMRLDGFLHSVNRYDRSKQWDDFYPETYRSIHQSDDIDHRIHSATRQIDWLLDRYGKNRPQHAWYESGRSDYRAASTLDGALRAIREDLQQIHRYGQHRIDPRSRRPIGDLEELRRSEQWLVSAISQLDAHREALLRKHRGVSAAEVGDWSLYARDERRVLSSEHEDILSELDRITASLDACLSEAAEVRHELRSLLSVDTAGFTSTPLHPSRNHHRRDRDALTEEVRDIDHRLSMLSRVQWLRTRKSQLLAQLGVTHKTVASNSPLADAASQWLVRLTGGRLHRIDWSTERFLRDDRSFHQNSHQQTGVTIQGHDEATCSATDRALAVMAVRLAAGDFLARTGRHLPLVIETHAQMSAMNNRETSTVGGAAYHHHGEHVVSNHPVAAALRDYASSGRQVIVLTSNKTLADQLSRVGARTFEIHSQRVVHPHRPLWKSQYALEQYVGPHPHTYGFRDVPHDQEHRAMNPHANINRDLDMAWRESNGAFDHPDRVSDVNRQHHDTDSARDGIQHRDGFYFANTYTTVRPDEGQGQSSVGADHRPGNRGSDPNDQRRRSTTSPFYLTVDSPIDQAPSIDAVASARLRGLKVTHITHLMQHDPNRLADALGLGNVDASTIRRWQAECRLVCRVPQLRGFDARVLVGCGITTPADLAETHPMDLLREVESFLATDRGQQILLSGTSHELSRITSWIATANSTSESELQMFGEGHQAKKHHAEATHRKRRSYYRGFQDPRPAGDESESADASRQASARRRVVRAAKGRPSEMSLAQSAGRNASRSSGKGRRWSDESEYSKTGRRRRSNGDAKQRRVVRYEREADESVEIESTTRETPREVRELKFYLNRESPVVDAPSIGERMAERLQEIEIFSIDDLLNADPDSVAAELDHRRVSADTVVQWQQQSTLVCCVPMLRGHDAQLLVAAEVVTPEALAEYDAEDLFGLIEPISISNEGKRILRGGKLPDLEEVTDWVHFAQHNRELRAA